MSKFVISIFYQSDFVGTLTACGACIPGIELETFVIEKAIKMTGQDIEKLIPQVPQCDRKKIAEVVEKFFL